MNKIKHGAISFTEKELKLKNQFLELKKQAGSHSPSIFTFKQKLPELEIKVDACFLSNPYATDLFLDYFTREIINTGKIRELLEFYPSQNQVIAEILAEFLEVNANQIFIGNGAIEIIQAVIHNFVESKIVINIPTFSSYYEFVKPGIEVVYHNLKKENDYRIVPDEYIKFCIEHKPDTIVLINPNNPDGGYMNHEEMDYLLSKLSWVKNIVLDESFIHFAYENDSFDQINSSDWVSKYPNIIILKSMSKDFGIAGIRAGYAIMDKARISSLLENGFLWNSNGLSEYFFRLYTRSDFYKDYNEVRVRYIKETIEFIEQLKQIPNIKVYPGKANFVLIELLSENLTSFDFVTAMLIKYGIYVRTCNDKIGLNGEFIRMASRTLEENNYMVASMNDLLSGIE